MLQERDASLMSQVRFHKTALDVALADGRKAAADRAAEEEEAAAAAAAAAANAATVRPAASDGTRAAEKATVLLVRAMEQELEKTAEWVELAKKAASDEAERCRDIKEYFQSVTSELEIRIEDMREARKREAARVAEMQVLRRRKAKADALVERLVLELATLRGSKGGRVRNMATAATAAMGGSDPGSSGVEVNGGGDDDIVAELVEEEPAATDVATGAA